MVRDQFLHISGALDRQVVTHARGDMDFSDPFDFAHLAIQPDQRIVRGVEVRADPRMDAGQAAAAAFDLRVLAGHAIHVGRGSPDIGDDAGKTRRPVADDLDLFDDGFFRAVLDDAAFMLGDRAEGAAAETATHDGDGEFDHLPGGNFRLPVRWMRRAGIGKLVDAVHLRGRQRDRRRREPKLAVAVTLHQRPSVAGIAFAMQNPRGPGIELRIVLHLFKGGKPHHGLRAAHDAGAFVRALDVIGGELDPTLGHASIS